MERGSESGVRRSVGAPELERVERIVRSAWNSLPSADGGMLESIGASQWRVVDEPLGVVADDLLRSAGEPSLERGARIGLQGAVGAWLPALRVVLIDAAHPALAGLDRQALEMFLTYVAWHEWGHALAIDRCSDEDVEAGERLLHEAPEGVAELIRRGKYRRSEYTYELVAEIYALLILRRRSGQGERPVWLNEEIYGLVRRVTGWRH